MANRLLEGGWDLMIELLNQTDMFQYLTLM